MYSEITQKVIQAGATDTATQIMTKRRNQIFDWIDGGDLTAEQFNELCLELFDLNVALGDAVDPMDGRNE